MKILASSLAIVAWAGQPSAATASSAAHPVCLDTPLTATTLDYVMRAGPIGSWQAGDGAAPVQLADGSTLLLMGDSIIDGRWVHNSILRLDGNCVDAVWRGQNNGTVQSTFVPHTLDTFYWPGSGYEVDGWLWAPMSEVRAEGEPGLFGFEGVDVDYARLDLAWLDDGVWRQPTIVDSGPWDNTPLGRLAVAHIQSDPAIVNFRVLDCGAGGYCGSYLARLTDLTDPAKPWLWWDGATWQDDPLAVADIAPGIDFFDSRVIHPIEHNGQWFAATWAMGYGASVAVLTAPDVTGPWTVISRQPTEGVSYLHGLFELNGELTMRWSNNDPAMADTSLMRPGFATVTS